MDGWMAGGRTDGRMIWLFGESVFGWTTLVGWLVWLVGMFLRIWLCCKYWETWDGWWRGKCGYLSCM
jgi:hypothetical protein